MAIIEGRALVAGRSEGEVVHSTVALSFWGGVRDGVVVDAQHPLLGQDLKDRILVIPGGRGSCTASQVVLQLVVDGRGPAGVVLRQPDDIISLGVIVAEEFFGKSIPVTCVRSDADFAALSRATRAAIRSDGSVVVDPDIHVEDVASTESSSFALSRRDRDVLDGAEGEARARALRIVSRVAAIQGASELVDVQRAHIDAVTYVGPAGLDFARRLVEARGAFKVPTTTNACSVDRERWRELGVPASLGEPAEALARAYVDLGAEPTFTCAPYILEPPAFGSDLGWSESNAVAYANSVCGAKTAKNADFLDACIALTGRAPRAGPHIDRSPACVVAIEAPDRADDTFWALAGYCVGARAAHRVPLVTGLANLPATADDLKNFAAAFATTSGAPLFHVEGHTPEASEYVDDGSLSVHSVGVQDLATAWHAFSSAGGDDDAIDLVALGSPHISVRELATLADLVEGRGLKRDGVDVLVTLARPTLDQANRAGHVAALRAFGVDFVCDTCWCMLADPVVPPAAAIVTNSAKYAHYAPGLVRPRRVHLAGLAGCVDAAISGRRPSVTEVLPWLPPRRTFATAFVATAAASLRSMSPRR